MKKLTLLALSLTITFCSFCQSSSEKLSNNSIQQDLIEIQEAPQMSKYNFFGDLGTYVYINSTTVNIETHFVSSKSNKVHLYGRFGLGGVAIFYGAVGYGGLAGLTMLTGKGNHHFETSAALIFGKDQDSGEANVKFRLPIVDLGYRFQKPEGGFIFRAKLGVLGAGVGLGYAF